MNTIDPTTQTTGTTTGSTATGGATTFVVTTADLVLIKTPSGKTIANFNVPEKVKNEDPALVDLIIRSESMKDPERQYWFNLTEIMNGDQTEKLRDILTRERAKLAEIDAKYGKKTVNPIQAAKHAQAAGAKRAEEQRRLQAEEAEHQAQEAKREDDILAELEGL